MVYHWRSVEATMLVFLYPSASDNMRMCFLSHLLASLATSHDNQRLAHPQTLYKMLLSVHQKIYLAWYTNFSLQYCQVMTRKRL